MSHNSRTDLPLYEIYKELIDHMKSSGDYDIMRINLKDPIEKDRDYQRIIEKFREECERFCESVDLNQNRQTLRRKLGIRFESYSRSRTELIDLIRRSLNSKNQEIKDSYYAKARVFLKRFLPESTPSPPPISPTPIGSDTYTDKPLYHNGPQSSSELTIVDEAEPNKPEQGPQPEVELPKVAPELDPDLIPIPLPSPPTPPPLPDKPDPSSIPIPSPPPPPPHESSPEPPIPSPPSAPVEIEPDTAVDMDISSSPEQNLQEDDELERMSLESVSSVKTADLSDFDNSIKLSDDEASIVGKPKNSKVPVREIQENITKMNDLQLIKSDNKKGPMDERSDVNETVEPMILASESDGGCSETTTPGRRVARTRKSNPKYSNDQYKIY